MLDVVKDEVGKAGREQTQRLEHLLLLEDLDVILKVKVYTSLPSSPLGPASS